MMDPSAMVLDPYATNPGPIDCSVLNDQEKHVSSAVWDGQERGALRCHEHTSKLDQWTLTAKQIELVEKAGFGYLRLIPAISLDNPLISALVERWRRETNTFHLNVGEMTITLKDVALLLGLVIDGEPVIGLTYTSCKSVCERYLGKIPESGYATGGMVKLSWLKESFSVCPEDATIEEIECHTRAYLLYLVGSTIFSTTTGNKVPVMYLPLFENFEEAGKYAWGAAALAFLYKALGNASLKAQSTISGCLTLVQCWSYFHLNIGRPKLNRDPVYDCFPLLLRWKGKQSGTTPNRDVVFYRKALDSLKACDVEWLPYQEMKSTVIPNFIAKNLKLGRSKTMLICFEKAERHLPDRCLRQFGLPQPIPKDVQPWERKTRGVDGGVDLSGKMESEIREWLDRQDHIVQGDHGVGETEYMQWYLLITRKFIGRPISLSTEFQRTNASLRHIADLADTFATEGLEPRQIELIARIRYIAHECLRDQVQSPITVSVITPKLELGKRARGNDRVHRKSNGKRMHEDVPVQGHADSEDDQFQFCDAVVEVAHFGFHHADNEVDNSQLCHADGNNLEFCYVDSKVDGVQFFHGDGDDDNAQSCHNVNKMVDSRLRDSCDMVNDSQLEDALNEIEESQICHVPNARDPQPPHASLAVSQQSSPGVSEDDSKLHDATNKVNGIQIYDETMEINETELCVAINEVDNSKFYNVTDDIYPQPPAAVEGTPVIL